jgi:DNA-directed RNA polymerase specialized sigma24 family protein
MAGHDEGSVTRWLGELKAGDREAVQPLWERYFERLVRLARARLRQGRRPGAVEDEEDAALSAFNSFCAGAERGRFPNLADRDDLWKLLVVITARKAGAQVQRQGRQKRGGGRVVEASDLPAGGAEGREGEGLLDRIAGAEPTPEFAAMVAEEYQRLLALLDDDDLRRVALDRMEGYTTDEIAARLGVARRTVARRLDVIRRTWETESGGLTGGSVGSG